MKVLKGLLVVTTATGGAAVLITAGLLGLLAIVDPFGDPPHPTDQELLAQFRQHRSELEAIVDMLRADPQIQRLAPDFTRPEPAPTSTERLADYRRRLAAAGIRRGINQYGNSIDFLVSTRGLSIGGSAKGFSCAEGAADDALVTDGDLDAAAAGAPTSDVLFQRHIDGNWWLQLDRR